jgi:mRNA interferase YafQ
MVYRLVYTTQFRRDFKRVQKQHKDMPKLRAVIELLVAGEPLPEKYRDHALRGNYQGTRDCHIGPDWLLIYAVVEDELRLIRTGSHTELFE